MVQLPPISSSLFPGIGADSKTSFSLLLARDLLGRLGRNNKSFLEFNSLSDELSHDPIRPQGAEIGGGLEKS